MPENGAKPRGTGGRVTNGSIYGMAQGIPVRYRGGHHGMAADQQHGSHDTAQRICQAGRFGRIL